MKPTVSHFAGGTSMSYDLGKKWLEISVKNIFLTSYSNYEVFVKYMTSWQVTDGHIHASVQYISTGSYAELKGDGNGTEFTMVMKEGLSKIEKISVGDSQIWVVGDLKLEEGG